MFPENPWWLPKVKALVVEVQKYKSRVLQSTLTPPIVSRMYFHLDALVLLHGIRCSTPESLRIEDCSPQSLRIEDFLCS